MRTPEQTLADLDATVARVYAAIPGQWATFATGDDLAEIVALLRWLLVRLDDAQREPYRVVWAIIKRLGINDTGCPDARVIRAFEALRDDNTYLHTVAQGIAHYTRCSEELPCVRCQRDTLREQTQASLPHQHGSSE